MNVRLIEQAEIQLKKLTQAIEQSPVSVVITDVSGTIEYVNPKFIEVTGYTLEEAIGANPRVLKSGIQSTQYYKDMWRLLASGKEWRGEFHNRKKNGELYWEWASISPIKDNDGEITHFVAVKEDITERKLAEEKLEKAYEEINLNLNKAVELHKKFMPTSMPRIEGFNLSAHYMPAQKLGGDFYNIIDFENQTLIYIVDVSGHGLDGAMLTIFLRETINHYIYEEHAKHRSLTSKGILNFIKTQCLKETILEEHFVCLLVGVLDKHTNKFSFSNAGIQIPIFIANEDGSISTLEIQGMPISYYIDPQMYEFTEIEIEMDVGSTLFIATDGLIEQENNGVPFGLHRIHTFLEKNYFKESQQQVINMNELYFKFLDGNACLDDVTFLVIQRNPKILRAWNFKINKIEDIASLEKQLSKLICCNEINMNSFFISLQEIITNAIEHGHKMNQSKIVKIDIFLFKHFLKLQVTDQGEGFDWRKRIDKKIDLENYSERGRGISLSSMCCEAIDYNEKGTTATLFFKKNNSENNLN
ncbi:hypothetical protein BHU72_02085 [Desulfuribacillus stibiiarsenatis]|uniref:PAS domain S-box protein n=1 Tax=Desulfuribacillus stibiiarsenatis TaxID=1390249 RepID=A0A1E5L671_9FIRM|nr:PAS domain S-box protein [Desulfuribacillus stibiiarsenatis]OEH85611.1 hypothetical protein BHU72_02085 [Desulfuribacillus stibiiarsenatis]